MDAVPKLVSFYTNRKVELATALVIREMGLQEVFSEKAMEHQSKEKESVTESAIDLVDEADDEKDGYEEAILGDIFNTPDCDEDVRLEVSEEEFRRAALTLVGLAGVMGRVGGDQEVGEVLAAGEEGEGQPCYTLLSYFHQSLISPGRERLEPWLGEGVTALTQLLNSPLPHPFLAACSEVCLEFVQDSLASLGEAGVEEQQDQLVLLLAQLGRSRHMGRYLLSCIIQRFSEIAGQLRESLRFCFSPASSLRQFEVLVSLVLEVWPGWVGSVAPQRGGGRRSQEGGAQEEPGGRRAAKRRSSGGVVRPLLSLGETAALQDEVTRWRDVLDSCTAQLSILQPDFCSAIWRIDSFCSGLQGLLVS